MKFPWRLPGIGERSPRPIRIPFAFQQRLQNGNTCAEFTRSAGITRRRFRSFSESRRNASGKSLPAPLTSPDAGRYFPGRDRAAPTRGVRSASNRSCNGHSHPEHGRGTQGPVAGNPAGLPLLRNGNARGRRRPAGTGPKPCFPPCAPPWKARRWPTCPTSARRGPPTGPSARTRGDGASPRRPCTAECARTRTCTRINSVVDVNNLVSLETGFSLGSYDLDAVGAATVFRLGREGETYAGIGKGGIDLCRMPLLADGQGPFGSPTSDSARDHDHPRNAACAHGHLRLFRPRPA